MVNFSLCFILSFQISFTFPDKYLICENTTFHPFPAVIEPEIQAGVAQCPNPDSEQTPVGDQSG